MSELIEICSGKRFRVLMTEHVEKQLKKADRAQLARCQRWMKKFSDDGFDYLSPEQLKHEGKFSIGDRKGTYVAIYAFKAWQLRLYGAVLESRFVVTEVDIAKKQNEADRNKLESAARKLADYV